MQSRVNCVSQRGLNPLRLKVLIGRGVADLTKVIAKEHLTFIAKKSPFRFKFPFVAWNTYSIPALRMGIYPRKISFFGSIEVSRIYLETEKS